MPDSCVNVTHNETDCQEAGLAFNDFCNNCRKVYREPSWEELGFDVQKEGFKHGELMVVGGYTGGVRKAFLGSEYLKRFFESDD